MSCRRSRSCLRCGYGRGHGRGGGGGSRGGRLSCRAQEPERIHRNVERPTPRGRCAGIWRRNSGGGGSRSGRLACRAQETKRVRRCCRRCVRAPARRRSFALLAPVCYRRCRCAKPRTSRGRGREWGRRRGGGGDGGRRRGWRRSRDGGSSGGSNDSLIAGAIHDTAAPVVCAPFLLPVTHGINAHAGCLQLRADLVCA